MRQILALILMLMAGAASASSLVVGANVVNPMRGSAAARIQVEDQLAAANVTSVRAPLDDGYGNISDQAIEYASDLASRGVRLDLILGFRYRKGAPVRAYMPDRFPQMWGGSPLSSADPDASESYFKELFDRLDSSRLTLGSIELGNEINWAAFNAEFPPPGEGRVFGAADLASDPEGQRIAIGYLRYLEILRRLKAVRDRSRYNHHTPIISAGLAGFSPGAINSRGEDAVTINATLWFLRQHGLDRLVDGYGVHVYPDASNLGDPSADRRRLNSLRDDILASCSRKADGHPCWITEWGFPNQSKVCPLDDRRRGASIRQFWEMISELSPDYRVGGLFYYSWDSSPWAKTPEADSVFRCGSLTEAGRLAIAAPR